MFKIFVSEYLGTIAVGVLVLALVVSLIFGIVKNKKRARASGTCFCGCSGCAFRDKCKKS